MDLFKRVIRSLVDISIDSIERNGIKSQTAIKIKKKIINSSSNKLQYVQKTFYLIQQD